MPRTLFGASPRSVWNEVQELLFGCVAEKSKRPGKRTGAVPSNVPIVPTRDAIPDTHSLSVLKEALSSCRGCPVYANGTRAVFGEGPRSARIVLVGEQPGDFEEREGRPFVGPAGKLLDRALEAAGIDRDLVYVTNAVKHFSFEERGKARLHKRPRASDVNACRPWLEAELRTLEPLAVVALGATAALSLFGCAFRLTQSRGHLVSSPLAQVALATWHPSMALRAPDDDSRKRIEAELIHDLKEVMKRIAER